jgi:DNA-binding transcriptional LysR family regulator
MRISNVIEDLKAYVAVVQEQSLTKAAAKLFLTQSAVSRRIQQLEMTLGGVLLDRTNRPPVLTPLGSRVYEHALRIIAEANGLLLLPQEGAEPTGTLRLGIAYALTEPMLLPIVQGLAAEFPKLEVRLKTGWSATLQELIDASQLDAAVILLGKAGIPSAASTGRRVGTIDVAIVQSRRHPLVRRKVSMADLANHSWVLNPLGCSFRAELERVVGGSGKPLRVAVDTHGAELQLNMVASGIGLGMAPRMLLKMSGFRNQIQIVNVPDFSLSLDVWTTHKSGLGNLSKAILLVSKIVETLIRT